MATQPIRAVLIGAGQRGAKDYAPFALKNPDQLQFVAVAEPILARREGFARQHNIPAERQFESWEELLALPQLGDAALVATQDWQHTAPALAVMRAGYHLLLEKPMATNAADCIALVKTSRETERQLHICHPFTGTFTGTSFDSKTRVGFEPSPFIPADAYPSEQKCSGR